MDLRLRNEPGVILVSQNGQPAMQHAYGLADEEKKIQVTPETRFDIASTTKCFTAVAVAQLVERGKLSFDATPFTVESEHIRT